MTRKTGLVSLTSAAILFALAGCEANPNKVDLKSITSDLSPELLSLIHI